MRNSTSLSRPSVVLSCALLVVALALIAAPFSSVRSFGPDLPPPWNKVSNLTEDQKAGIEKILADTEAMIAEQAKRIEVERTEILRRQNQLPLAKMQIAQWTKGVAMNNRQQARDRIMALLSPPQRDEAVAVLANLVQTTEIVNFKAFAARQQNDYFCWAACLQMLFNYAGVEWDQDQIANEIKGTSDAQTATPQEISKGGTGWRFNSKDPSKNWSANVAYHNEFPPGGLIVGMLQRNIFILVELRNRHVAVLYKISYRETMPYPTAEVATIYDPLTGEDVALKWTGEADKQITGWWEATADYGASRVFSHASR